MEQGATRVRWGIVGVTAVASLLLYLDRYCVSFARDAIQQEFDASPVAMSLFVSAFFYSYALGQVPASWIGHRFGIRFALTMFILTWSLFTGLIGAVTSVTAIIVLRLLCGFAQAGAFPCAGRVIRDWMPISQRGAGSSYVTFGGRVGGAIAPVLTGSLMLWFALLKADPSFQPDEILDPVAAAKAIIAPEPKDTADWFRKARETAPADSEFSRKAAVLAGVDRLQIAAFLNDPETMTAFRSGFPWDDMPSDLRKQLDAYEKHELGQAARQFWQAALPKHVKKLESRGWRPTLILFGVLGIFVAFGFWWLFREDPSRHPWCNPAEVALIQGNQPVIAAEPHADPFPWSGLLTNINLWANSLMQATTNVGWIFLGTTLPRYLDEVHQVPVIQRSVMSSIPLFAGMIGILLGGPWTDRWTYRMGRRWGRSGPIALSRILAVVGYALALVVMWGGFGPRESITTAWIAVFGLSLVAIATDLGVPATWAWAQDVGGKHTSAVLGWANMWGNLGAALAAQLSEIVLGKAPTMADWTLLFVCCGGGFAISGISACVMDATRPLSREKIRDSSTDAVY